MTKISFKKIIIIVIIILILYLFFQKSNKKIETLYTSLSNETKKKPTLVNFNASWCYWSKKLNPTWKLLQEDLKENDIDIIDFKCDLNTGNDEICKQKYNIDGYPTIKLFHDGKEINYNGDRSLDDIKSFIRNNILN